MVFFEAARRLGPALTDMAEAFGTAREAAVAREIGPRRTPKWCARTWESWRLVSPQPGRAAR